MGCETRIDYSDTSKYTYHPSTISVNSTIDTAQPFLEILDSKEEAKVAFPNAEWPLTLDELENMKDNVALRMNQAIS